ncbi:glycosyltransferase family A protein [Actibacterium sp. 188UL27-1]|uniref:glycosyltransferase family 2 protein n=1 Tax=Actibacterium sp. 188UL27-1 TaxID=2786961 RepID=UPI0019573F00|nr:glycosyltransferase family 2 protein [Actibacterium sp. 188UL27-1]
MTSRTAPGPQTPYDVIIPLYNGGQTIETVIDGLTRQTRHPSRIIVIDDGSSDGAPDRLAAQEGIEVLPNPEKGANAARQFGLSQSTAPYLALLDQDDAPCPWHFEQLAQALDDDPTCPAAMANAFEDVRQEPRRGPTGPGAASPLDPWGGFPFFSRNPSALLIRRQSLDAIGGWSSEFPGIADLYTMLRLSERRPMVVAISRSWWVVPRAMSYSTTLRRENPVRYFDMRVRATQDAAAHRLELHPEHRDFVDRRLHLQTALRGVMEAFEAGQTIPRNLSQLAIALEEALSHEAVGIRRLACRTMFWYLTPLFGDPAWRRALVHGLVDAWPSDTAWTRSYFLYAVAKRLSLFDLARLTVERPISLRRWHLLAAGFGMHARDGLRAIWL